MTVRNILEILKKDQLVLIACNERWVFIPNEEGKVSRIQSVPACKLLQYAPEELLSATVVCLEIALPNIELSIECPAVNTILDDIGETFINCDPTDWDFRQHR